MWIAFFPRIPFAFVNQDTFAIIACYAAKRSLNSHILSVILTAIAGVIAECPMNQTEVVGQKIQRHSGLQVGEFTGKR